MSQLSVVRDLSFQQHNCPNCGAPLSALPSFGSLRCSYCAVLLTAHASGWRPAAPPPQDEALRDPHLSRLWLNGCRYALLGRLAQGESSDVFFARRDGRMPALVIIKVLRTPHDADLMEREQQVLEDLEKDTAKGSSHFSRFVPQRVGYGRARLGLRGEGGFCTVAIHRWRSGFIHTFDDVRSAHPNRWFTLAIMEWRSWACRARFASASRCPPFRKTCAPTIQMMSGVQALPRRVPTSA